MTTVPVRARRRLGLLCLVCCLASASSARAHRLDEYLQATIVEIEPDIIRLRINLTPGVDVAARVLDQIDRDHDGVISANEAAVYVGLLKHDLALRLDETELPLTLTSSQFPSPEELRSGWGIIQLVFTVPLASPAPGEHRLTLENRHLAPISAYLFNAARPKSAAIQIRGQRRNQNQSVGEIEFTVATSHAHMAGLVGAICLGLLVWLGMKRRTGPTRATR